MADFEFAIPLCRKNLLEGGETGQYAVEDLAPLRELPAKLRDAYSSAVQDNSPFFIFTHFDTLFTVLEHISELTTDHVNTALKTVLHSVKSLITELDAYFKNDDDNDSAGDRHNYLTATKMLVYLLCELLDLLETQAIQKATEAAATAVKGKGKRKASVGDNFDIESERNNVLIVLYQLTQLELKKLWSPPVVEQDFVNLIANSCYKILENPVLSHSRMRDTRDSIFQIIGTLVKRYGHSLGCVLKILQLLQLAEHAVPVCAQGVALLVESYGCANLVNDLVREIGHADARDMSRDSSTARNYAAFLTELSVKVPAAFVPTIGLLTLHLDEESYTMRNGVLSVFAEIVLQVLTQENMDDKQRKQRDHLLELLVDHIQDVHAFVRSKVLQLWSKLCSKWAIPLSLQKDVLRAAVSRLNDKSSTVRKNAIHLVVSMMRGNPYSYSMPLRELKKVYNEEKQKLQQMLNKRDDSVQNRQNNSDPREAELSAAELWKAMEPELRAAVAESIEDSFEEDDSEDVEEKIKNSLANADYRQAVLLARGFGIESEDSIFEFLKKFVMSSTESDDESVIENEETEDIPVEENEEISKQKMCVQYLEDMLTFAEVLNDAVPVLCQMLGSQQASDVLEAIDFFVAAFEVFLPNAMTGIRKMLNLIWSPEKDICAAVVEAYKRLYMNMSEGQPRKQAIAVVSNLTGLAVGASTGELEALEELIVQCVKSGDLPKACIQVLWERFSMTLPDTTEEDSRIALLLISMIASADLQVVSSNIEHLVSVGLGERGMNDLLLANLTCMALAKLAPPKPKQDSEEAPLRLPSDHEMFQRAVKILVERLNKKTSNDYCEFAVSATTLIYQLAENPDSVMGEAVKQMYEVAVEENEENQASSVLKRILVVLGQVAVRQLIYLDVHVYGEIKRRINVKEKHQNAKKNLPQERHNSKRKSISAIRQSLAASTAAAENENEEDEIVGAVADDREAEIIREACETELLSSSSLLWQFVPIILAVSSDPTRYRDPSLRAAATLCLSQFMLISPEFCEKNLQLLFTILERSPEPMIRSNIVVALGDLNFRYPNSIEPWTPRLYARLRDSSPAVKKTTLNVLTHLILNDMVKVKGQISDMALCIVDPDVKISNMAQMFFSELGQKGNALYNVMPDIISRLSDPDANVDEEDFRTIMRSIMGLIQKERQAEGLVEKIILRLGTCRTERHVRDLAFSLSLLSFNDKSLRRLLDHWNCVSDKLNDSYFSEVMSTILSNAKKLAKLETKTLIDEIEVKIREATEAGGDDEDVSERTQYPSVATASKTQTKTAKKRRGKKTAKSSSDENSEPDDDDVFEEPRAVPAPSARKTGHRTNRSKSQKKQPKKNLFPDEDFEDPRPAKSSKQKNLDDSDDDPGVTPSLRRRAARKLYANN